MLALLLVVLAQAPQPSWRKVEALPAKRERALEKRVEPAPAHCPAEAAVFAHGARALIVRHPCSGPSQLWLRDAGGERRVGGFEFYAVGAEVRVVPLSASRLALLFETPPVSVVFLVDEQAATASFLANPPELREAHHLQLDVAEGTLFLSGGSVRQTVGALGCENPPPGQGCDLVAVTRDRPNKQVLATRP